MSSFFSEFEDLNLPDLTFDAPKGFALVGYWCWRAGGHICDEACKSDSVPLFAQRGWATGVRRNIELLASDPDEPVSLSSETADSESLGLPDETRTEQQ